ncbi:hypothetical protein [Streptomyces ardesiacus]
MSAIHTIDAAMAPALGDVRSAGPGDLVYILPDATSRKDWAKYWEAVGVALSRGAQVVVMRREEN